MVSMPRALILVAALAASVPVSGRHIVTTKITWPREVARIVCRVVWRGAGKAAKRDDPPFTQKTRNRFLGVMALTYAKMRQVQRPWPRGADYRKVHLAITKGAGSS